MRRVKVGAFPLSGYQEIVNGTEYRGYGYDFLRSLEHYANLEYDFVGADKRWGDMFEMLRTGQIDLWTGVARTPERDEVFSYSHPIGTTYTRITVRPHDDRFHIKEDDFSGLNGIHIGTLKESSTRAELLKFARKNRFAYRETIYDTEEAQVTALRNHQIDAILGGSTRKLEYEKLLTQFAPVPIYVAVRKGDEALLNEINYGIEQMDANEGDWRNTAYYANFVDIKAKELVFTPRERAFIDEVRSGRRTITAAVETDAAPYSYWDGKEFKGIIPAYFAHLMQTAGLPYKTVVPRNLFEAHNFAGRTSPDVLMNCVYNQEGMYGTDAIFSEPYMQVTFSQVTLAGFQGAIRRVATVDPRKIQIINSHLADDVSYLIVETREAALKAVEAGEADAAYVYSYFAEKYVYQHPEANLAYRVLNSPVLQASVCVNPASDHTLAGIINKVLRNESPQFLDELFLKDTNYEAPAVTVRQFLVQNPRLTAGVFMVFSLALLVLSIRIIMSRNTAKLAAEHLAYTKSLQEKNEELERLVEREAKANQAKREFLFNMSHDIRTPMNAILGFAELANYHLNDTAKLRDYIRKIHLSGNNLLGLINNVLEMSRIESGKSVLKETLCDMNDFFRTLLVSFEDSAAKKHQTLTSDIRLEHPQIYADATKMQQVVTNILSNAVKYTPDGGTISITVTEHPVREAGKTAVVCVIRDTGIGISKAFLPHIFDQFEREHNTTTTGIEGSGLGMSIVKKLIDLMGGAITIESEQGKGTTVRITTVHRLAPAFDGTESANTLKKTTKSLKGVRILLAEDNPLNAEIAVEVLRGAGVEVDAVGDGEDCVKAVMEKPAGYYAAVLMDIQMPRMDGYAATKLIRAFADPRKKRIPVIAMTANAFAEDQQKAMACGMDEFLAKPLNFMQMLKTLDAVIEKTAQTA